MLRCLVRQPQRTRVPLRRHLRRHLWLHQLQVLHQPLRPQPRRLLNRLAQTTALYAATKSHWAHTMVRFPANMTADYQDTTMEKWLNTVIGGFNSGKGLIVGGPDTVPENTSSAAYTIPSNYIFRGDNSANAGVNPSRNLGCANYQTSTVGVPWISEIQSTEMCQSGSIYCAGSAGATVSDEAAYGYGTMKAAYWVVYTGTWLPSGGQTNDVENDANSGLFPIQSACPLSWNCNSN